MTPTEDSREHAAVHLREDGAEDRAPVARSMFEHGERVWDCVIRDPHDCAHIRMIGADLILPHRSTEDIGHTIQRIAVALSRENRIHALRTANPVHVHRDPTVHD
jgi:hypothetical protein